MKRDNVHSSVIITFQKPIIERDDGQNINSCVATHSEKNACGAIGYALSSEHFHRHTLMIPLRGQFVRPKRGKNSRR